MPDPLLLPVRTWSNVSRAIAGLLVVLAIAVTLLLAAALLLDVGDGGSRLTSLGLAVLLAIGAGVPWLILAGFRRWTRGSLTFDDEQIVLTAGRDRFEIPRASITSARWSRLPLPSPMFQFALASGRRFERWIEPRRAESLPSLIADGAAFALARSRYRPRWRELVFKFALFPLLPTFVVFRLHQVITYGGLFGEYQQRGLGAWLTTLAAYGAGTLAHLVVIAVLLRLLVELASFTVASAAPRAAGAARRFSEHLARASYYAGVPALLAWFLLR